MRFLLWRLIYTKIQFFAYIFAQISVLRRKVSRQKIFAIKFSIKNVPLRHSNRVKDLQKFQKNKFEKINKESTFKFFWKFGTHHVSHETYLKPKFQFSWIKLHPPELREEDQDGFDHFIHLISEGSFTNQWNFRLTS